VFHNLWFAEISSVKFFHPEDQPTRVEKGEELGMFQLVIDVVMVFEPNKHQVGSQSNEHVLIRSAIATVY